jgi:hypothetical protein
MAAAWATAAAVQEDGKSARAFLIVEDAQLYSQTVQTGKSPSHFIVKWLMQNALHDSASKHWPVLEVYKVQHYV